jgi:hypothetical protein
VLRKERRLARQNELFFALEIFNAEDLSRLMADDVFAKNLAQNTPRY